VATRKSEPQAARRRQLADRHQPQARERALAPEQQRTGLPPQSTMTAALLGRRPPLATARVKPPIGRASRIRTLRPRLRCHRILLRPPVRRPAVPRSGLPRMSVPRRRRQAVRRLPAPPKSSRHVTTLLRRARPLLRGRSPIVRRVRRPPPRAVNRIAPRVQRQRLPRLLAANPIAHRARHLRPRNLRHPVPRKAAPARRVRPTMVMDDAAGSPSVRSLKPCRQRSCADGFSL
jgi:hypothetical protein